MTSPPDAYDFNANSECCACDGKGPVLAADDATKKFIVYMSDGESNLPRELNQADTDSIKAKGITTIAVGVGPYVKTNTDLQNELKMIATDDKFYFIDEYSALADSIKLLQVQLCLH